MLFNEKNKKKIIKPLGGFINVGDLVFGEGEVGYITRKQFSKSTYSYLFEVRLTSQIEILLLQCTAAEIINYIKTGVWKYYPITRRQNG